LKFKKKIKLNSKIVEVNTTMDFYASNIQTIYGINTNKKLKKLVNMYISCNVSLLPNSLQNA